MGGTENASPRYAGIEGWSTGELVEGIVDSQLEGLAAVRAAAPAIVAAIEAATLRLREGGRLVYVGAGTSGRIATQDAAELPPTFSWPYERAIPVMAGGEGALIRAVEGAEDDVGQARRDLEALSLTVNDVVIGIAASGRTPYVVAALGYAREKGALAISIFNNHGARLQDAADIPILVETGEELLAGSTRMKAGTAQKVVLNCISTAAMIKLGFVYRGLMVEMRPTNSKLQVRAELMVAELASCEIEAARTALRDAGGSIKVATVMLLRSLPRAEAERLLADGKGNLRAALGS
jgi:N-acetylmuramic acid 6-phosphate etherase